MSPFLRRIQEDVYYRLLGAATLDNIAFILQRTALTEEEIQRRLATVKGRSGKAGICAIVAMPALAVPSPDAPGPVGDIAITVLVLEHPDINAGSLGTGSNAEEVAVEIVQQLHHFMPGSVTQVLTARRDAILPDLSVEGLVGYAVTVHTSAGLERQAKVAMPEITRGASGFPTTATITCATSGATIRYTLDGSYPSPGNTAAAVYAAPVAIAAAAEVRAVASKAAHQQSNAANLNVS